MVSAARNTLVILLLLLVSYGCSLTPGSVQKLKNRSENYHDEDFSAVLTDTTSALLNVVYLGCGGIYIEKDGDGVLIDPFFSNQKFGRISASLFFNKGGKKTFRSDNRMIDLGMKAIAKAQHDSSRILAVLSAHSHYDHLMDIPAVLSRLKEKPAILLNETGFNILHRQIDSSAVQILERRMSTPHDLQAPIVVKGRGMTSIHIYPILADHNPHFRHIKFFSGAHVKPVDGPHHPFDRTKANLWLEGRTFSFVIDYVNGSGEIEFRFFIQSSSCNPPAGIPPLALQDRPVDLAFIGVVSYAFSPSFPCDLLSAVKPKQIVWVHWEDFFRKYSRSPKTVRGTDVPGFFELPCVVPFKNQGKILAPRVKMKLDY